MTSFGRNIRPSAAQNIISGSASNGSDWVATSGGFIACVGWEDNLS